MIGFSPLVVSPSGVLMGALSRLEESAILQQYRDFAVALQNRAAGPPACRAAGRTFQVWGDDGRRRTCPPLARLMGRVPGGALRRPVRRRHAAAMPRAVDERRRD